MQSVTACSALKLPLVSSATCIQRRTGFAGNPVMLATPYSNRRSRARTVQVSAKNEDKGRLYQGYNPKKSVFPAEACDEQGGEACEAEFGEEVKPKASPKKEEKKGGNAFNIFGKKGQPDREYQDYAGDKTVFKDEACDDLGGEFCEPEK